MLLLLRYLNRSIAFVDQLSLSLLSPAVRKFVCVCLRERERERERERLNTMVQQGSFSSRCVSNVTEERNETSVKIARNVFLTQKVFIFYILNKKVPEIFSAENKLGNFLGG